MPRFTAHHKNMLNVESARVHSISFFSQRCQNTSSKAAKKLWTRRFFHSVYFLKRYSLECTLRGFQKTRIIKSSLILGLKSALSTVAQPCRTLAAPNNPSPSFHTVPWTRLPRIKLNEKSWFGQTDRRTLEETSKSYWWWRAHRVNEPPFCFPSLSIFLIVQRKRKEAAPARMDRACDWD